MIVCRRSRRGALRRSLLCIVGLIILGVLTLRADAAASASDEPALDDRLERLIERLREQREQLHVPGMAIAVVKDDEVILSRGLGYRDLDHNLPATDETIFAIGSTTKAFTSALVAMLVEEGKLDWDDPLHKHLEDFALHDEAVAEELTIRDALSHRTGLGRTDLVWMSGRATPHDILRAVATAEPRGTFREHFGYNNPMYLFTGMAISEIERVTWYTAVTERLLQPLGMNETTTSVFDARRNDEQLAKGYRWDDRKEQFEHMPMRVLDNIAPAGAINSNVRDMAQWLRLMLGRGEIDGKRLISEEQIDEMWTGHIEMGAGAEYGLGWVVRDWRGRQLIEHSGGIDGFMAQVAMLPEENLGFVLLTNVSPTPLGPASIEFVFDALLGKVNGDDAYPDAGELQKFLGEYHFDPINDDVTVLISDGKLAVDVPGQMVFKLLPPDEEGKWQFEMTDEIKVSFVKNDADEVVAMKLYQAGMTFDLPLEGVERDIVAEVEPDEVAAYLGRYEWELGSGEIEILIRNGRLAADVPGQTVYELHLPDDTGRWPFRMSSDLAIRFNREEGEHGEDAVTSLTIFHGDAETEHQKIGEPIEWDVPSVDELVDRVMVAHGISSERAIYPLMMRERVRLAHQGIHGEGIMKAKDPHTFHHRVDFGQFGSIDTVVEHDSGRVESPFGPPQDVREPHLSQLRAEHPTALYQDWRKTFDSIRILGLDGGERGNDLATIRVELTSDDFSRTALVDPERGLIVGERYRLRFPQGVSVWRTITYADHREVDGLVLPHHITTEDDLLGRTEIELIEVRLRAE